MILLNKYLRPVENKVSPSNHEDHFAGSDSQTSHVSELSIHLLVFSSSHEHKLYLEMRKATKST